MKYCTKCGYQLPDEAKFCNACGASAEAVNHTQSEPENPYASQVTPATEQANIQSVNSHTEAPKTDEELLAEEQALLNKFSIALKHERLAWKIYGIVLVIITAYIIAFGLIMGIFTGAAAAATGGEAFVASLFFLMYLFMGLMFLPIAIINLSMKNKLEKYRAKLYTDCTDGIGHFSVGSIVFCAFFNGVALVFNIVYFIIAKNNAAVIERIKARQKEYNSQQ